MKKQQRQVQEEEASTLRQRINPTLSRAMELASDKEASAWLSSRSLRTHKRAQLYSSQAGLRMPYDCAMDGSQQDYQGPAELLSAATTDINSVTEEGDKGEGETCSAMRRLDVKPDAETDGGSLQRTLLGE